MRTTSFSLFLLLCCMPLCAQKIDVRNQIKGQVSSANGGTGTDTSALTGCPKLVAGTWEFSSTFCSAGAPSIGSPNQIQIAGPTAGSFSASAVTSDVNGNVVVPAGGSFTTYSPVNTNVGTSVNRLFPSGQSQVYSTPINLNCNWAGSGANWGNVGAFPSTEDVTFCHNWNVNSYNSGIFNLLAITGKSFGSGDKNWINLNVVGKWSVLDASGEGAVPLRLQALNYNVANNYTQNQLGAFLTSITGPATGPTFTGNCDLNCFAAGSEQPIIDTNQALTVTVTAITHQQSAPALGYDDVTISGSTLAGGQCFTIAAQATPGSTNYDTPVLTSVSFQGLSSSLAVGAYVGMGSPFLTDTPQVASVVTAFSSSGGTETVMLPLTHPLLAGGPACSGGGKYGFAERNVLMPYTKQAHYVFPIIGYPAPNTIRIAHTLQGVLTSSYWGATGEQITLYPGTYVSNAGTSPNYAAYPGNAGTVSFTLAPSPGIAAFSVGDKLINAQAPGEFLEMMKITNAESNPFVQYHGLLSTSFMADVSGSPEIELDANYTGAGLADQGGPFYARGGLRLSGIHSGFIHATDYPEQGFYNGNHFPGCVICFFGNAGFPAGSTQQSFDILGDYTQSGAGGIYFPAIQYYPGTKTIEMDHFSALQMPSMTQNGHSVCDNSGTVSGCATSSAAAASSTPATATGASGVTSVTCITGTCTSYRGTFSAVTNASFDSQPSSGLTVAGPVLLFSLSWAATPSALVCTAGGSSASSVGLIIHDVATTTGVNIYINGSDVQSMTLSVDYSCQP